MVLPAMTSRRRTSILHLLAILIPLTNALPLQRRDSTSNLPIILVGILILCPSILLVPFIAYRIFRSRKAIAYRLINGETMPTQKELVTCWQKYGQKLPGGYTVNGNVIMVAAPATHEELMQCWGLGEGSNGNRIREERRRMESYTSDGAGGGG